MNSWQYGTVVRGERGDTHMLMHRNGKPYWMALCLVPDEPPMGAVGPWSLSTRYVVGGTYLLNANWDLATFDDEHGMWVPPFSVRR